MCLGQESHHLDAVLFLNQKSTGVDLCGKGNCVFLVSKSLPIKSRTFL